MKQENYVAVASIEIGCGTYHFAIYDDGNDYQPGDKVIVSGRSDNPLVIEEVITPEEAATRFKKKITAEVINKINTTAYDNRVAFRKRKEKLEKEMEKRKKEIQKTVDEDYYASKDEAYAEMLKEYRSL